MIEISFSSPFLSNAYKQQVSFSYRRRTVGQKLDVATSLSFKTRQLKLLSHKAAVFRQTMAPFVYGTSSVCSESYSQAKLVRFFGRLYLCAKFNSANI